MTPSNDDRRRARLDAGRKRVDEAKAHSAEVLAAMDATLSDFPVAEAMSDHPFAIEAAEKELAALRAELLAATAARAAVQQRYRELFGPVQTAHDLTRAFENRNELDALWAEGERQDSRIAVLQMAIDELSVLPKDSRDH